MQRTRLEELLELDKSFVNARDSGAVPIGVQGVLDVKSSEICAQLTPQEIIQHVQVVYDDTAHEYANTMDHRQIPECLPAFMQLIDIRRHTSLRPSDARVLDIGCGPLARDIIYMAAKDPAMRMSMMERTKNGVPMHERIAIPAQSFSVDGLDSSEEVCVLARKAVRQKTLVNTPRIFHWDMHAFELFPYRYHALWSCASLFMHTPKSFVRPTFESLIELLYRHGHFGLSYQRGTPHTAYDNLRYSQTGRVKYFSRPDPDFIALEARRAGLHLVHQSLADLTYGSTIKKGFFAVQFFQKK